MNIEYDLKEILTEFKQEMNAKFNKLEMKTDKLTEDINGLGIRLAVVEAQLKSKAETPNSKTANTLDDFLHALTKNPVVEIVFTLLCCFAWDTLFRWAGFY